ncbi:aldo/keto reductase [Nesterenkonia haasae]|uniref:aldo/keto reductase n=1 Tax=Nesterenkonia haasae TaxID=2587813 RepID=UPI001390F65C|nr:aldo/keto reductase [Nesterenkonia haasae]NDK32716.1 aldo/keto reductase [Nesterenkonia haasae]
MSESTAGPVESIVLNDCTTLPKIGLGTYKLRGRSGAAAVESAIRSGYRLLDSAYNYENEGSVGAGIAAAGVDRNQLRVTTKLPGRYHERDQAIPAVEESLFRAGLEYFDLCLIHWPNPKQGKYVEAWRALIELRERGLLRSIGVSNFLPEHLETLQQETGVLPSVNQLEIHPWFPQTETIAKNHELGIAVESWSPVGRQTDLQQEPLLAQVAAEVDRSVVQTLLRWHVQRGAVPIPKSSDPERQRENLSVFDFTLSDEQVDRISSLARPEGRLKGQDPAVYEEF